MADPNRDTPRPQLRNLFLSVNTSSGLDSLVSSSSARASLTLLAATSLALPFSNQLLSSTFRMCLIIFENERIVKKNLFDSGYIDNSVSDIVCEVRFAPIRTLTSQYG
jgi:hypothetical protein